MPRRLRVGLAVLCAALWASVPAQAQTYLGKPPLQAPPEARQRLPFVKVAVTPIGHEKLQNTMGLAVQLCVSRVGAREMLLVPDENRLLAVTPDDQVHAIDLAALLDRDVWSIDAVTEWQHQWVTYDRHDEALLFIEQTLHAPKIKEVRVSDPLGYVSGLVPIRRQGRELFLATGEHRLFLVDPASGHVSVYAGTENATGLIMEKTPAKEAYFSAGCPLVRDADWVYMTDRENGHISRLNVSTDTFEPFAGRYEHDPIFLALDAPQGLFLYGRQLLVADGGPDAIVINLDSRAAYAFGQPADGPSTSSPQFAAIGVAAMGRSVYVTTAHRILKLTATP